MWNDVRHAVRTLLREPAFAAVSVLTLALGIGAATAIFSVVNGVLLRPLPYGEPERLTYLREIVPAIAQTYPTLPVSARHFTEWRQRASSFESLAAVEPRPVNLTGGGEPERIDEYRVSANLFDTLAVRPALGRGFVKGEDEDGRDRVAVLADSLWRRRFHADRAIIGKTITLDSRQHTIVGVLAPSFRFPAAGLLDVGRAAVATPEVFRPKVFSKEELGELMGNFNYGVIARLKPGVTAGRATAELNVIAPQLVKMSGEGNQLLAVAMPLRDSIVGKSRTGLLVLLAAVGCVLLIVCVNLANLALARGERRGRECAIRTALGATGGRMMRLALTESLLVAVAGGVLGMAVAAAGVGALVKAAPADIPRLNEVALDARVLLFAFAVTTLTGMFFGLAPAWRMARTDPQSALKGGGRTTTSGPGGMRLRGGLVTAEVALSAILLVMAALLMSSFLRVVNADKGFAAPTVLAVDVMMPSAKYSEEAQRNAFHERVLQRLAGSPGVASAGISTALPLQGETWVDMASLPEDTRPFIERPTVNVRFVNADYFRTMGIPLLGGRTFSDADRKNDTAILSERTSQTLWPGKDPVGRTFIYNGKPRTAIGVVRDVRAEPHKPAPAMVYRPYWEWAPNRVQLVVRAKGDPLSVAGAIRAAIRSVDPEVPVPAMRTMRDLLEESVAQRRFQMIVAGAFAMSALLLAAIGIYGVVSYSVARRTNEMGIRMALGARAGNLYGIVLRQAMAPVVIGLAAGLAGAVAAGRVLASLLYEISPRDPLALAGVTAVLASVGLAACLVPARRAARVDPLVALRYE